MKREILNKPNQLIGIKAEKSITTTQRKAYNVLLKVAQKEVKFSKENEIEISKDKLYWFDVDVTIVHKCAGVNNKNLEYIYEELKKLMGIIVTVREEDNPDNWESFSILPKIRKEDGVYEFALFGNIIEALKKQNYFTTLDLLMIQSLSSQYSIIFYELAVRYQRYKIPKMTIKEIREITNTQNKYSDIRYLKKRVLDTACEEISQKTDIILTYTTEKRGRRIAFIDFKIEKKQEVLLDEPAKTIPLEIEVKKQEYSPQVLELFNLLPPSEQVESNKRELDKLLKDHSFRYLRADIDYAKSSQPDNFMGFIKASCQSNHYSSAELEKKEQKKELARKREEKKQRRKEMEEKIRQKAREMAKKRYKSLSEMELENYNQEYKRVAKIVPKSLRPKKEAYILGVLEDEFREELGELFF